MNFKNLFNIKRQLNKPEYLFNPKQLLRRLKYQSRSRSKVKVIIDNSGKDFFVNENEVIGRSILTMGVYDLVVAEAISRIIGKGDTFIDIGANIGYFSRLALSLGGKGQCYEPHPKVFQRLTENTQAFSDSVELFNCALSDKEGSFDLYVPESFSGNEGIASLEPMANSQKVKVKTQKLNHPGPIRLLKIDVEGHEPAVLEGAQDLLKNKKIDFIVFEDFEHEGSETQAVLDKYGYKSFRIKKTLNGPEIINPEEGHNIPLWEPPNYIASHDPKMIAEIFSEKSWTFYSSNSRD